MLVAYFAAISNGHEVEEPRITTYQGTQFRITAAARPAMPVQADGRVIGYTPVTFAVLPRALTVMVPARPQA